MLVEPSISGIAGGLEYDLQQSPYYSQYQEILPKLKKIVKGKDNVKSFGKKIGVCTGTMYSYLRGGIPNLAVCKLIVEEGLRLIEEFNQI